MPFFGRNTTETAPAQPPPQQPVNEKRRSGLFGRRHTPENTATNPTAANTTNASHHNGLLHRRPEDASIVNARERVLSAEAAERDADKALQAAKLAVREAREHVKILEREAAEE